MYFLHSEPIWNAHPDLHALTMVIDGVLGMKDVDIREDPLPRVDRRQAESAETAMPEIAAWRATFSRMGLTPSKYHCGAESLLRRYRKEQRLPSFHPLVDYLNAFSMAFAVPIAAFDCELISGGITVRPADGSEAYHAFSGEIEHPAPGEVVFADEDANAHSRRWTFRQSARSLVTARSDRVLIVAEALHAAAPEDLAALGTDLTRGLGDADVRVETTKYVSADDPRLEF